MKRIRTVRCALLAALAAGLFAFAPSVKPVRADSGSGLPTEDVLTAKWWEWVYSLPVSDNPLFDETGALADVAQPYKGANVFFLVGVINVTGSAERFITVPKGTAFFFPVINSEFDNVGVAKANRLTVPQLAAAAKAQIDSVTEAFVYLDDVDVSEFIVRVQSPPFSYQLPATDNIAQYFGIDFSGASGPAVADGYWFYLPALPPGNHVLEFGGAISSIGFSLDITYYITVE
jgi:hypothetical protein